jgi:vacuolar protein sorting-associated protein 13A/C
MVWNSTNSKDGPVIKEIKDGSNKPWWFEDWKTRRETTSFASNNLNVQIDGAMWESLRDIQLDTEGEHMHSLRPMVKNVQHRIVFDVKLVDNIKIVTIRSSLVIENRTLLSVDVASIDPSGKMDGSVKKVAPGEDYSIPIEKAYTNRFCIRPDGKFNFILFFLKIFGPILFQIRKLHLKSFPYALLLSKLFSKARGNSFKIVNVEVGSKIWKKKKKDKIVYLE